jgi:D-alanyl-D-alanine dipeptidase
MSLRVHAAVPQDFVDVTTLAPSIIVEARYFTEHNFIGAKIDGYKTNKCYLAKPAAEKLAAVQRELQAQNLSLRVYDCYRPQKAVNHFVRWAKDLQDTKMKSEFYPEVAKENLFQDGYIAEKSGHSRGSTLDLTIDGLDMGSPYDFFDPLSHTANPKITGEAMKNRLKLKSVMEKHGFANYDQEWWHYTLKNEPHKSQYFDFDVE